MGYSDKRLIINAREPAANEFVMHTSVQINDEFMHGLMEYIDKHSNLSVKWIDREHFVEPGMMGFKLVKKTTHD